MKEKILEQSDARMMGRSSQQPITLVYHVEDSWISSHPAPSNEGPDYYRLLWRDDDAEAYKRR